MEAVLTHGACALQLGGTLTPQALRQELCSRSTSLFDQSEGGNQKIPRQWLPVPHYCVKPTFFRPFLQ